MIYLGSASPFHIALHYTRAWKYVEDSHVLFLLFLSFRKIPLDGFNDLGISELTDSAVIPLCA